MTYEGAYHLSMSRGINGDDIFSGCKLKARFLEKSFVVLLSLCFLFILAGCGKSKPGPQDKNNTKKEQLSVTRDREIIVPVEDSLVPHHVRVDDDYIYIVEQYFVLVYSRKNFRLVKKFGSRGEGPGQFRETVGVDRLSVKLFPNEVYIGSLQKGSYYTREGKLKKEKRLTEFTLSDHFPFDGDLIGCKYKIKKEERTVGISYRVFGLFNDDGELEKEICDLREPNFYEENGFINDFCTKLLQMDTCGGRIYISGRKGFVIDIYDENGELIKTLEHDYVGRKLTEKEKEEVYNVYKVFFTNYRSGRYWPRAQRLMQIPERFSAFYSFLIADEKIYVQTYKSEKDNNADVFVFDLDGNHLQTISVPFYWEDFCKPHAYTIKDETLSQVVPNEETEGNDLHIIKFRK